MNKNIILVSLLALHCGLYSAEKKSDSTEGKATNKTEGELVLDVLKHCNAGTLSSQQNLLLDLWQAGPEDYERIGGHPLWEVELSANATVAGVPLLAHPKTVAYIGATCPTCPQMKTYKVPTACKEGVIYYAQLMLGGMYKNGKCAVALGCHNLVIPAALFKTPIAFMLSPHIAPSVKAALGITTPCTLHAAAKEAASDKKE